MQDLTIEIEGKKFVLPLEVYNLIANLSNDCGTMYELLTHTHNLCKLQGKYDRIDEVEDALKPIDNGRK